MHRYIDFMLKYGVVLNYRDSSPFSGMALSLTTDVIPKPDLQKRASMIPIAANLVAFHPYKDIRLRESL